MRALGGHTNVPGSTVREQSRCQRSREVGGIFRKQSVSSEAWVPLWSVGECNRLHKFVKAVRRVDLKTGGI